jgi:capsular polysaccharide transport system ATP-binding protein
MLEMKSVSKSYKLKGVRKHILEDVSFSFPEGRNIAIMGKNGAGKSTLMRLLAGIETPDRGRIKRDTRTSWPMGFSGGFNGSMTGLENVRFVARLYGQDTEAVIAYVEEFAGLGKSLRLPIKTYSSGMRARLAFGLSMAIDFDCYLIDEITAVGDKSFRTQSKEAFDEKLSSANLIMISHSLSTIREYCDCGIFLKDRSLTFYPDVEDLIDVYQEEMRVQ